MALSKITYTDKETLNPLPSVADKNKVTDSDMNEIKSVVNGAIDQVEANTIPQQATAPVSPNENDLWIDTDEPGVMNIDSTPSTSSTNPIENQAITNYVNGTLLWTNPDSTQAMGATSIPLSSSDYDIIEIFYKHFTSDDYILSQRTIKGAGTILLTNVAGSLARRQITQTDDTTLSVQAGDNTSAMIPVYIVGYKNGIFN